MKLFSVLFFLLSAIPTGFAREPLTLTLSTRIVAVSPLPLDQHGAPGPNPPRQDLHPF